MIANRPSNRIVNKCKPTVNQKYEYYVKLSTTSPQKAQNHLLVRIQIQTYQEVQLIYQKVLKESWSLLLAFPIRENQTLLRTYRVTYENLCSW